jgi:hypothetical protein
LEVIMAGNPTGNAITNQIAYIANMIGKRQMPYGGSPVGNYLQQLANPFQGGAIQRRPVVNPEFTRPDYSGASERERRFQEYRTGRDIPGANTDYSVRLSGGSPAAQRAFEAEKSRVAQLTAQDPELQRYELARQKAVAAGAGSTAEQSAEDLGMQMWAKANPGLAANVKPGQSGYEAIQGTLAGNAARAGQGFGIQEQLVPTPQGFPTSVPGLPEGAGFGAGFNIPQALMQTPAIPFGTQQAAQTPAASAAQSAFGQPSVLDTADFERLLQQLKK